MDTIYSISELTPGSVQGFRAVSFDLWLTLIRPNPESKSKRTDIIANHLGVPANEALTALLGEVSLHLDKESERTGTDFNCFDRINLLCERLKVPHLGMPKLRQIVGEIQQGVLEHPAALINSDTQDILMALKQAGLRLALISNTGYPQGATMREVLKMLGIAECFDFMTFSDESGIAKPNPAIYQMTLQSLGVSSSDTLHIGDSKAADYEGARASGIQSKLFNRAH